MRFPTVGQYLESLSNPEGMFRSLRGVEPLCTLYGEPICRAGNFSVVFKVRLTEERRDAGDAGDARGAESAGEASGVYALKCYTRPVERIGEICDALSRCEAGPEEEYPVPWRFLPEELYVYDEYERGGWFPVVLSEWVEGETLGRQVARLCQGEDREGIAALARRFDALALWLLRQPFAHGDIKQDNILVDGHGRLRLIDFDSVFLPRFAGEKSGLVGSPAYQHPARDQSCFNLHIDDYPLGIISLSLHALAHDPGLYARYSDHENLILSAAEVAGGRSELFGVLYRRWLADGAGAQTALCRALLTPVPQIPGLESLLRYFAGERALELLPHYETVDDGHPACALIRSGGRFGYADLRRGRIAVYPLWDEAHPLSEGVAFVRLDPGGGMLCPVERKSKRRNALPEPDPVDLSAWRAIDSRGQTLRLYPGYSEVSPLREGLARVCRDGLYGFIDREGVEAIPPRYLFAASFRRGRAKVRLGAEYFYIDCHGHPIEG